MSQVRRIYVEKKKGFDVEAQGVLEDLRSNLSITLWVRWQFLQRAMQSTEMISFILNHFPCLIRMEMQYNTYIA